MGAGMSVRGGKITADPESGWFWYRPSPPDSDFFIEGGAWVKRNHLGDTHAISYRDDTPPSRQVDLPPVPPPVGNDVTLGYHFDWDAM